MCTSLQAELQEHDEQAFPVEVENLSIVGLMARTARALDPGTRYRVTLALGDLQADAMAVVARVEEGHVALRFEELPYESFERLRTLLLKNADEPGVIADELSDRMGFLGEAG